MGLKNKKKKRYHKKQQQYEDNLLESDDTFAFIAGCTSGGFPYGITWEEMEEIERKEKKLFGNKCSVSDDEKCDLPFD